MLPLDQMRAGARVLAAIFGGPGVFYVLRSFDHQAGDALSGIFYLALACAITFVADEPGRAKALARWRIPFSWKRRP